MKIHKRYAVFGSRFIYFVLALSLAVCIPLFPWMAFQFNSSIKSVVFSAIASFLCLLGLLVATDSWRFIRLTIGFLLLVPIFYIFYFCQVFFIDGMPFSPSFHLSRSSPFSAFVGLLFWGIPAIMGAIRLMRKATRIAAIDAKRRQRRIKIQ